MFSKSHNHHEYHDMLQVLMRKGGLYAKLVMTLVYRAIVESSQKSPRKSEPIKT